MQKDEIDYKTTNAILTCISIIILSVATIITNVKMSQLREHKKSFEYCNNACSNTCNECTNINN